MNQTSRKKEIHYVNQKKKKWKETPHVNQNSRWKDLIELRFYGSVNPLGLCQACQFYLTTLILGRLTPISDKPVLVFILLLETDNCLTWISGRERMTKENILWSIIMNECYGTQHWSKPWPPDHQPDVLDEKKHFMWIKALNKKKHFMWTKALDKVNTSCEPEL